MFQPFQAPAAYLLVRLLLLQALRLLQLDQIEKRIRITCKHAGTAGAVHRLLAALAAFAVMVTVDDRAAQLIAHFVELITKVGHLICAVLIARDDLVDRVDHDRDIVFLGRTPDQLRRQLIHRYGIPSQVPYIDVVEVLRWDLHGFIHIFESMQTGRSVQLQVDIHDTSLGTLPRQPLPALCDRDAHLDLEEALSCL